MSPRVRMSPLAALHVIQDVVNASGNASTDTFDALDDLEAFIADMLDEAPHEVDVAALARLYIEGTTYRDKTYTWEPQGDDDRLDGWGQIASALGWECRSCREDVGWVKWDTAIRNKESGEITLHVVCGHCQDTTYYSADGEPLDDLD